jgi:hypothetical protein
MKKIFLTTILAAAFFLVGSDLALASCTSSAQCSGGQICRFNSSKPDEPGECGLPLAPKTDNSCKLNDDGREICSLENPLSSGTDIPSIISVVIKTALGIIGGLTLLMLVWGGFQWLTSAGNSDKVHAGTQTMIWAVIGVVLVFASYILLSTFTSYLTGAK